MPMDLSTSQNWLKDKKGIDSVQYINSILRKHQNLDFVKRIMNPENFIVMPSGNTGTHFMVYGELNGYYVVYPRIVNKDGDLQLLDETEAWNHAKKSGEMIYFNTAKEANWFSKHYNDIWKGKFQADGKPLRNF